jgi:RNA polymerase sigma-70 factor (ECF subfamily)
LVSDEISKGNDPAARGHISTPVAAATEERLAFERLLGDLRPKLHRYCARMTGAAADGEDVLQEALMKAIDAFEAAEPIANLEGWLFRVAHNAALDFLRRRARQEALRSDEDPEMIIDPAATTTENRAIAAASLRTFMRLPVAQRSSVILMDVLGYSLEEISAFTNTSIPAIKAALHRGRARLRELAQEPEDIPLPALAEPERSLLAAYVERFNARDFDALRKILADEVRLELVNKARMNGRREVSNYFHNYDQIDDWQLVPGLVDRRPAVLVRAPDNPTAKPVYFILLTWAGDQVSGIRDFRFARYVTEGAEIVVAPEPGSPPLA